MNLSGISGALSVLRQNAHFRTLVSNASLIFSGNGLAALMGFASSAIAARTLGVQEFGVLAMVIAYVQLVSGLANSNSWQALIKFGSAELNKDSRRLTAFIGLSFFIDVLSQLSGFLLSCIFIFFFSSLTGWPESRWMLAAILSISIIFSATGAPIGVLRLFGDFKLLSLASPLNAAIVLIGYLLAHNSSSGIIFFIYVRLLATILTSIYFHACSFKKILDRGMDVRDLIRFGAVRDSLKAFLSFLLITNANSTVSLATKQSDVLVVGALAGEASAGIYRIVKLFAQLPALVQGPLYQAVYPQFALMVSEKKLSDFSRLALQSSYLSGGVILLYWFGYVVLGAFIVDTIFGVSYSSAWVVGLFYLGGSVISGFSLPLQPALLAFGKPGLSLRAHLISNSVYLVLMFCLIPQIGLIAAGISFLIFYIVWAGVMFRSVRWCYRINAA